MAWKEVDVESLKVGQLTWQRRMPGGVCIILEIFEHPAADGASDFWADVDYPVFKLWHPSEGIIEDPSYYYESLDDALNYARQCANNDR